MTAPSNLTATSDDDKQSTLAWDAAPDNSITSYQYRVSGDGGAEWDPDWTDVPGNVWSTTAYTVMGLTNRIPYTFEVRTARTDQTGPAATAGGTPEGPPTVPNTPKNLRAGGQDGTLDLSWHAPPLEDDRVPVTSYTVRYRPEGSESWTTITSHKLRKGVTWQYLTINGLENSQHYEVQVAALNRLGASQWTSTIGTPQPSRTDPPPPPDGQVALPELNVGGISAVWTRSSGSDYLHPGAQRSGNTVYDACDGTLNFKVFWEGPEAYSNTSSHHRIADEYQVHINKRGGAGHVNYWFDYEFEGTNFYGMYGDLSVRGGSRLSIQVRSYYEGQGWSTWTKPPVSLSCSQE